MVDIYTQTHNINSTASIPPKMKNLLHTIQRNKKDRKWNWKKKKKTKNAKPNQQTKWTRSANQQHTVYTISSSSIDDVTDNKIELELWFY